MNRQLKDSGDNRDGIQAWQKRPSSLLWHFVLSVFLIATAFCFGTDIRLLAAVKPSPSEASGFRLNERFAAVGRLNGSSEDTRKEMDSGQGGMRWTSPLPWQLLLGALLIVNAYWIGKDIWRLVATKLARRNQGEFSSETLYVEAIQRVGLQWLASRPPLEQRDVGLTVTDIIVDLRSRGLKAFSNPLKHSWPQAVLAKGIAEAYIVSGDAECLHSLRHYCDAFLRHITTADGCLELTRLDEGMHGELMLVVYEATHDDTYMAAAKAIAQYYLIRAKNEGGTLGYLRPGKQEMRFVDALPMMCPFLARYGALCKNSNATDLAIAQLSEFIACGVDAETGIPYHAYDPASGGVAVGLLGWGRGVGWYAVGLIDTICSLPRGDQARIRFELACQRLLASIHRFQRPDGGWGSLLTQHSSRFDSSATALLTYFLCRMKEEGLCDVPHAADAITRAVSSLKAHTRQDGKVDFSQGNCMGFDRMSKRYAPTAYAQGMTVAAMHHYRQATETEGQSNR